MNPEKIQNINFDSEVELSSSQRYFKVYNYSYNERLKFENQKLKPYIFVMNDQEKTIREYMLECFEEMSIKNFQAYQIKTEYGNTIDLNCYLSDIKRELKAKNIDGLGLYICQKKSLMKQIGVQDQCCLLMIQNQFNQYNASQNQFQIQLPDGNYIYFPYHIKNNQPQFKQKVAQKIQNIYNIKIDPNDLIWTSIRNKKDFILKTERDFHSLMKGQKIKIKFQSSIKLPAIKYQNKSVVVFKKPNGQTIQAQYESIKYIKIQNVLSDLLKIQNSKQYGLKVMDFILKPIETLSLAGSLFKNVETNARNIVAHVIEQSHIFYHEVPKINQLKAFEIDTDLKIHEQKENISHKQMCKKQIKRRAMSTKIKYFNSQSTIMPLIAYTSSIKYKNQKGGAQLLYSGFNTYLRTQEFGMIDQYMHNEWPNRLASNLICHLENLKPFIGIVYRGVGFKGKHKINDIIKYKQFNSSSASIKIAKEFAKNTLYIIKSISGKPISQYSFYEREEQIIFTPYTQFKVIKHYQQQKLNSKQKIDVFELEQLPKKPLPSSKATFVLWVDDKKKQGQQIWNSFTYADKSAVLVQLQSTNQLEAWLNSKKSALTSEGAQVLLITNMVRTEKDVEEKEAGVKAVKIFRRFLSQQNLVIVYIGYKKGAIDKLNNNGLSCDPNLIVTDDRKQIFELLQTKYGLK